MRLNESNHTTASELENLRIALEMTSLRPSSEGRSLEPEYVSDHLEMRMTATWGS